MNYTTKGPGDIGASSDWDAMGYDPAAEEREAKEMFKDVRDSLSWLKGEPEMVCPAEVDQEFTSKLANAGYSMTDLIDTLRDSDNHIHKKAVECYDGAVYTITEQEFLT